MKFKKGSKVEIMNKEMPASWRVGEIVSSNGHGCNVRYDGFEGVEKVSRRFIRPSPPAVGLQRWSIGDIVEVFDGSCWKIATVLKAVKGGRVLVRPHGFSHEMKVHRTNIRSRQSWIDDQWIAIGKMSGSYGIQTPLAGSKIDQEEDDYDNTRLQESHIVSKSLKRASPFCSSLLEIRPEKAKKVKLAEKDQSQRHLSTHPSKKVDVFEGNKYNNFNGYYEMEKRKTNGVLARITEPNESDNDQCSVGSCSVPSDAPNKLSSHYDYDADNLSSDGESFSTSRVEHEVAVSIHRLELHAYRSTLEALYASGPLSWEKEALLTNLRINLNISNDEHLTELKNLISPGAAFLD